MGEENRESSGGSTAMIVLGVVGAVLLIGCCGIIGVFGAGMFWVRSAAQDIEMRIVEEQEKTRQEMFKADEDMQKANQDFQKAMDGLNKELESVKIPDDALTPAPNLTPLPPSGSEEEKK